MCPFSNTVKRVQRGKDKNQRSTFYKIKIKLQLMLKKNFKDLKISLHGWQLEAANFLPKIVQENWNVKVQLKMNGNKLLLLRWRTDTILQEWPPRRKEAPGLAVSKVSIGKVHVYNLDFFFLLNFFSTVPCRLPAPLPHTQSISNIHKLGCKERKIFSSKGKQCRFSQKSWKGAQQEGRRCK